MLNIKENEFSALTEEQGTKVQTALQGSLPAGCVHYFLPLLVSKKVEINGKEADILLQISHIQEDLRSHCARRTSCVRARDKAREAHAARFSVRR